MFERFKAWLIKQLSAPEKIAAPADSTSAADQIGHENVQNVVPYDENLLERSRTQWQFGDWASLAALGRETLQHHPDRAKLALLAAAGHLQQGDNQAARQFTRLAQDWGCSKKLISQILISGVHNSLGRTAAIAGHQAHSLQHFECAISVGTSGSDTTLLTKARYGEQLNLLGLTSGQISLHKTAASTEPSLGYAAEVVKKLKEDIKSELNADLKANNPNPYAHNRTLTPTLNKSLREYAESHLGLNDLTDSYIDYLAAKSIQIERNCVGRLATTVQDAIARQLVAECVEGERICILEIGALYGVSLAILYNHAITRFSSAKVVCLDPFEGYYGKALDSLLNQPVNDLTFIRNMRLSNVPESDYGMIKQYSTQPEALAAAKELPINLLIIDGDHSFEGVKFDFDAYFPLVQPGGYVIFDDYNAKEWPDVKKFIDQDLKNAPDFEYLGAVSRTAVGRKRK